MFDGVYDIVLAEPGLVGHVEGRRYAQQVTGRLLKPNPGNWDLNLAWPSWERQAAKDDPVP